MNVRDLQPGDIIRQVDGSCATVIVVHDPHPVYPDRALALVIWWVHPSASSVWPNPAGFHSFDALSPYQDVGELELNDDADRSDRWTAAVRGCLS